MSREALGKIVTIAKRAGGLGATTSVFNLGHEFAELGYKVLMVDMTPQHNLTNLACKVGPDTLTIYDVLAEGLPISEAAVESCHPNLWIVPGDSEMSSLDFELSRIDVESRFVVLRNWFTVSAVREKYDITLIDLDPAMNGTAINALVASTHYANPVEATAKGLESIRQLNRELPSEVVAHNPDLRYLGTFVMRYDVRPRIQRKVVVTLNETMPDAVFDTLVRTNIGFMEAEDSREPISIWEKRERRYGEKKGTQDIRALTGEFIARLQLMDREVTRGEVVNG